jgi:hypothetical protein
MGCHCLTGFFPPPQPNFPVFGMEDFANAIAYEVKQEIADRYFGFRTRIENQAKEYLAKIQATSKEFSLAIQLDLCRIQFLLQEPRLFRSFLQLIDLPLEEAINLCSRQAPPKGQELFIAMRGEGFTRWRRFRGLAILVYRSLADNIATYRDIYLLLQEEHTEICMEIDKFQRQNNLSDILCFLRNLDSPDAEKLNFLHSNSALQCAKTLGHDLHIAPPAPVTEAMILLNLLPPLQQIKGQFTELLKQAFARHDRSDSTSAPF